MKTVFLANNSGSAKFIANRLHEKGLLDATIIEEASAKTKTKVFDPKKVYEDEPNPTKL